MEYVIKGINPETLEWAIYNRTDDYYLAEVLASEASAEGWREVEIIEE